MRSVLFALTLLIGGASAAFAQNLQPILQTYTTEISKPSRGTVSEALDAIAASDLPQVTTFLEQWSDKNVHRR